MSTSQWILTLQCNRGQTWTFQIHGGFFCLFVFLKEATILYPAVAERRLLDGGTVQCCNSGCLPAGSSPEVVCTKQVSSKPAWSSAFHSLSPQTVSRCFFFSETKLTGGKLFWELSPGILAAAGGYEVCSFC